MDSATAATPIRLDVNVSDKLKVLKVVGDWNDWNIETGVLFQRAGPWRRFADLLLTPGLHCFKLVGDGKWFTSPNHAKFADPMGNMNSSIVVRHPIIPVGGCILIGPRAMQLLRVACFGRRFDPCDVFVSIDTIDPHTTNLAYRCRSIQEMLPEQSDLARQPRSAWSDLYPPYSALKFLLQLDNVSQVYMNMDWFPSARILADLPRLLKDAHHLEIPAKVWVPTAPTLILEVQSHLYVPQNAKQWRTLLGDFITARRTSGLFTYDAWLRLFHSDLERSDEADATAGWTMEQRARLPDLRRSFLRTRIGENFREHDRFFSNNQRRAMVVPSCLQELEERLEMVQASPEIAAAIREWAASRSSPLQLDMKAFASLSSYDKKVECAERMMLILSMHNWLRDNEFMQRFRNEPDQNLGALVSECILLSLQSLLTGMMPDEYLPAASQFDDQVWRARVCHYNKEAQYNGMPNPRLPGAVDRRNLVSLPPVLPMAIPTWEQEARQRPQLVDPVVDFVLAALPDLLSPTHHFRTVVSRTVSGVADSIVMNDDIFVYVALNHINDHLSLAALTSTSRKIKRSIENAGAWKALFEKSWSKELQAQVLLPRPDGDGQPPNRDYKEDFKVLYLEYDKRTCDHCGEKHKIMSEMEWYGHIDNEFRHEDEYVHNCPCPSCGASETGTNCPQRSRFIQSTS